MELNRLENNPIVKVTGLKKSFDSLLVLDNISFSIQPGEILSILGPSGAGKTTLLKCLIGIESYNDSDNSVLIDGHSRNEYLKTNRIAYVPQRYSNYPWLNVFENIRLGMASHGKPTWNLNIAPIHLPALATNKFLKSEPASEVRSQSLKQQVETVHEIIDVVGLTGFEKYSIDQLSGGMQQRVAIGRALAQNTDIIALDEPFGALDFNIRGSLQLLVKRLQKTVLFVTHDVEEAIFIADKLVVLSKIPTTITNDYTLPFRADMNSAVKFEEQFIKYRREIQFNLTQARELIDELRTTGSITSLPLDTVLSFPLLDALRNEVDEDRDREIILNLINRSDHLFRLGVMLLRSFREDQELNTILATRFESKELDLKSKFFLLHELSYRESGSEVRGKIWQHIKDNFGDYKRWEVDEYFHGKQNTIVGCRNRLEKPEHKTKRWIYLVSMAGTGLQDAKQTIETYVTDDDEFVSSVAKELIANTDWNSANNNGDKQEER